MEIGMRKSDYSERTVDRTFTARGLRLDLHAGRAEIMGVLNVTPDSFSDGGRFLDPDAAVARAGEMIRDGARIIDVGGASSRPKGETYGGGAVTLQPEEEISRVEPVVREVASRWPGVWISIDTYHPSVAEAALEAGAHIVNDITGLRANPEMADVAAQYEVPVILMHSVGLPGEMPHTSLSDDLWRDVERDFSRGIEIAERAGVRQIVLDPGFGFGKTHRDNLRLVGELRSLRPPGYPILIGVSRKSAIGAALAEDGETAGIRDRLYGSLGATAIAVENGASIIRTHDVRETADMIRVMNAIRSESGISA
jgi:dihydropteroate synthase